MGKKHRFGIDIDGTITDPATFVPHINEAFNKNLSFEQITSFHLPTVLGCTDEQFMDWMDKNEATIYAQSPLAPDAKKVLHEFHDYHTLIYISARPTKHSNLTQQWFDQHGIPYHTIDLLGSHKKIERAKQHNVHLFFEDKLDNANDLAEELNIPIILFDTPYNREATHKHVQRVKTWNEAKQFAHSMFPPDKD